MTFKWRHQIDSNGKCTEKAFTYKVTLSNLELLLGKLIDNADLQINALIVDKVDLY